MKLRAAIILFVYFALALSLSHSQATAGYHRVSQVLARGTGVSAQVVPYATVAVTNTGTGLAGVIYADPALTVRVPNSVVTSDANGNFGYYFNLNLCMTEKITFPNGGGFTQINICSNGGSGGCPTSPCQISGGGTSATTAAQALINLGAQAALGYTPVNKAGDTMTGPLVGPAFYNCPTTSTVLACINLLPSTGGTITLANATYQGGMNAAAATLNSVKLIGSGVPIANSGNTALIAGSGTIIQGSINFSGASNIEIGNLGVDVGDVYNNCTTGTSEDGVSVYPINDSVSSPMIYNIYLHDLITLACDHTFSPASLQHSTRIEHATNVTARNILTINGYYGLVFKTINTSLQNINSQGSYSQGIIIKSDDTQGVSQNVTGDGINISNFSGDAIGIQTYGATVSNILLSNVQISGGINSGSSGIVGQVNTDPSTGNPGFITGVKINGCQINGNGANANLIDFQNGSTQIDISHCSLSNTVGSGGAINFHSTGASNNSASWIQMSTIGGYGIITSGNNDQIDNIFGTGVADGCVTPFFGVLTVGKIICDTTALVPQGGSSSIAPIFNAGLISSSVIAPASNFLLIRPGSGASQDLVVQNAGGTRNDFELDPSGNWKNNTGIVIPQTAGAYTGASTGRPVLADTVGAAGTLAAFDSSGGLISGGSVTSGYYALSAGATFGVGHLDDGVTTASTITSSENFSVGSGTNVVYRCATAGATLPTGSLTINAAACGTTTDTGLRVK